MFLLNKKKVWVIPLSFPLHVRLQSGVNVINLFSGNETSRDSGDDAISIKDLR